MKISCKRLFVVLGVSALALAPGLPTIDGFGADAAYAKNGNGGGKGGGNGGGRSEDRGNKGGDRGDRGNRGGDRGNSGNANRGGASVQTASVSPTSNRGGSETGRIARELKGLNAYHALVNGSPNAAPNSQVGRLATYRDAAIATGEAEDALAAALTAWEEAEQAVINAQNALADLPETQQLETDLATIDAQIADIQSQIEALDPEDPNYDADLAALEGQITALEEEKTVLEETYLSDEDVVAAMDAVAAAEAEAEAAETAYFDAQEQLEDAQTAEGEALDAATGGRTLSDEALAFLRAQLLGTAE